MGYAIAERLAALGATVHLVSGPVSISVANPDIRISHVVSAREMFNLSKKHFRDSDITVLAAAVADYTPRNKAREKIKKKNETLAVELVNTTDIAMELGKLKKKKQILVGFALETENEKKNAKKKLVSKNFDMIVLNSLKDKGAGFGHDTNKITIFTRNNKSKVFELKSKTDVANDIVNEILPLLL